MLTFPHEKVFVLRKPASKPNVDRILKQVVRELNGAEARNNVLRRIRLKKCYIL